MDGTGQLTVRTARDGDRVLVEIGDNGPGIPEAAAAHTWSPSPPPSRSARAPASGSIAAGGSSSPAAVAGG
jgi:anti-sigma regulatory factor (Ser/Thr protein kinase)